MKIFHVSAECYPVAKVGGLADVVGALPKYQKQLQNEVKVVMPHYKTPFANKLDLQTIFIGEVYLGSTLYTYSVSHDSKNTLGFELYLIDIPPFFNSENVYEYGNDAERFLVFQLAFLNWISETGQYPDVLHLHDHHTGFIPFLIQNAYVYQNLKHIPTFFTIHNAQYHGSFGFDKLHYFPDFDHNRIGMLEWNGQINPLAAAIKNAWKVSTVSPTYLEEMTYGANGLEDLLRWEKPKSIGILNGIDTEVWNPETDTLLEHTYSIKEYKKGKEATKKELCQKFGLNPQKPLFAFIGRLVYEKGADLLPHTVSIALHKFPQELNILMLGSGDPVVESQLRDLLPFYKGNYNVHIGYDEKLSHQIYAGADFLLMPSRVEPCGLNQMYALRYGTIPIVRRTGGLQDTVVDIGDNGYGICHVQANVEDIIRSIERANELYQDKKEMEKVIKKAMKINNSWEKVAESYIKVYKELTQLIADSW